MVAPGLLDDDARRVPGPRSDMLDDDSAEEVWE